MERGVGLVLTRRLKNKRRLTIKKGPGIVIDQCTVGLRWLVRVRAVPMGPRSCWKGCRKRGGGGGGRGGGGCGGRGGEKGGGGGRVSTDEATPKKKKAWKLLSTNMQLAIDASCESSGAHGSQVTLEGLSKRKQKQTG